MRFSDSGRFDQPMAEAGSTRNSRRSEKPHPTTAASNNKTTLMTTRLMPMSRGIDPGGMAASRATTALAAMVAAIQAPPSFLLITPSILRNWLAA